MYNPVVSNEYEIATYILKSMLKSGLVSQPEFNKIDDENKRTFITGTTSN